MNLWQRHRPQQQQPSIRQLGASGEKELLHSLRELSGHGNSGKILHNLYIPWGHGQTAEIDVVFITQTGIFVLESKNYSGCISGSERDEFWQVTQANGKQYTLYNPIWQNYGHLRALQEFLPAPVPLFSLIVFSNRGTLQLAQTSGQSYAVVQLSQLNFWLGRMLCQQEKVLSDKEVRQCYHTLKRCTHAGFFTRLFHILHIKKVRWQRFFHRTRPARSCPVCGGKLILRTASQGKYAGQSFYGCSRFPECHYIEPVADILRKF